MKLSEAVEFLIGLQDGETDQLGQAIDAVVRELREKDLAKEKIEYTPLRYLKMLGVDIQERDKAIALIIFNDILDLMSFEFMTQVAKSHDSKKMLDFANKKDQDIHSFLDKFHHKLNKYELYQGNDISDAYKLLD